jgi:DNA invertase Pin-like site-specific DNA recombinase
MPRRAPRRPRRAAQPASAAAPAAARAQGATQGRDITPREAELALRKHYGRPPDLSYTAKGSAVFEYVIDDNLRAGVLAVVRMSTQDGKKGNTVLSHLNSILDHIGRFPVRPYKVVVTTQNSGARPFEDRPDIDAVIRELHAGRPEAVAYRNVDRIARDVIVGELFCRLLQRTNTALYVNDFNHPVNWDNDALALRIHNIIAEEERRALAQRTGVAFIDAWLAAGKGYPNLERKLGFMRRPKPDNFLVVDPDVWGMVLNMFEWVAKHGLKRATAMLRGEGLRIRDQTVSKLVRDPVYMHGEMVVEWKGIEYPVRPVALTEPVPQLLWEAANNALATTRGAHTHARPGQFALNGIRVTHADCRGAVYNGEASKQAGTPVVLVCRIQRGDSIGYRHWPALPLGRADRTCIGFVAPQELLEPLVCRLLRQKAGEFPAGYRFSPRQRALLDKRVAELVAERARLENDFFDRRARAARGEMEAFDMQAYSDYLDAVNRQLRRLRRRRATWDALSDLPSTSTIPHPHDLLLEAFCAIVTDLPPGDPYAMARRQLVIEACLDEVICFYDDTGELRVELRGPTLADDPDCPVAVYPLQAARPFLEAWLLEQALAEKKARRTANPDLSQPTSSRGLGVTTADKPWYAPPRAKAPNQLPVGQPGWVARDSELEEDGGRPRSPRFD